MVVFIWFFCLNLVLACVTTALWISRPRKESMSAEEAGAIMVFGLAALGLLIAMCVSRTKFYDWDTKTSEAALTNHESILAFTPFFVLTFLASVIFRFCKWRVETQKLIKAALEQAAKIKEDEVKSFLKKEGISY